MLIKFTDSRAINSDQPAYVDSDQVAALQVNQEHIDGPRTSIVLADGSGVVEVDEAIDEVATKINEAKSRNGGKDAQ